MNPLLIGVIIKELPALIGVVKDAFHKQQPGDPVPSEADIFVAFNAAFYSSLAKDEAWLAAHPPPPAP